MDYAALEFITKETFRNVTPCSMVNAHRCYGTDVLTPSSGSKCKPRKYLLRRKKMENLS
jgi:hypothetical protein